VVRTVIQAISAGFLIARSLHNGTITPQGLVSIYPQNKISTKQNSGAKVRAFQNFVDVGGGAPEQVSKTYAVGDEPIRKFDAANRFK